MKETIPVKINITHKGSMLINDACIFSKSQNAVNILIDMKSKRGEIIAIGSDEKNTPCLYVSPVEDSCDLDLKKDRNDPTVIELPEYSGWNVFSATVSKYTIYCALVRKI